MPLHPELHRALAAAKIDEMLARARPRRFVRLGGERAGGVGDQPRANPQRPVAWARRS